MYSILMVANNILDKSFADNILITPGKLQRIAYLVDSEYRTLTGESLVSEQWETWTHGAHSAVIHHIFDGKNNRNIKKFARDINGHTLKVDEAKNTSLDIALNNIWESTKNLSYHSLCHAVRLPGSAWDKAYQEDQKLISHQDMVEDTTYRSVLALPWEKPSGQH